MGICYSLHHLQSVIDTAISDDGKIFYRYAFSPEFVEIAKQTAEEVDLSEINEIKEFYPAPIIKPVEYVKIDKNTGLIDSITFRRRSPKEYPEKERVKIITSIDKNGRLVVCNNKMLGIDEFAFFILFVDNWISTLGVFYKEYILDK